MEPESNRFSLYSYQRLDIKMHYERKMLYNGKMATKDLEDEKIHC